MKDLCSRHYEDPGMIKKSIVSLWSTYNCSKPFQRPSVNGSRGQMDMVHKLHVVGHISREREREGGDELAVWSHLPVWTYHRSLDHANDPVWYSTDRYSPSKRHFQRFWWQPSVYVRWKPWMSLGHSSYLQCSWRNSIWWVVDSWEGNRWLDRASTCFVMERPIRNL